MDGMEANFEFSMLDYFGYSCSSNNGEKWDVFASVCLERKPQISKPMTRLEKKYIAFLNEFELESSYKSDHEIRHMNDE